MSKYLSKKEHAQWRQEARDLRENTLTVYQQHRLLDHAEAADEMLAAKDTEIARLREALAHIATLHVNYADPANNGPDFSNEYSIGITDGLRCAAKFARAALERKHG